MFCKTYASKMRCKALSAATAAPIEQLESRLLFNTYTVTTLADSAGMVTSVSAGSYTATTLRAAIAAADAHAGADTIKFAAGLTGTINIGSALPPISDTLTLTGPGASKLTVQRSSAATTGFSIFILQTGETATISGLTIARGTGTPFTNGNHQNVIGGGGIYNLGTLTVVNCTISGNTAAGKTGPGEGGGICSYGPLVIENSTVSSNSAVGGPGAATGYTGVGGGVFCDADLTISGSTVSQNRSIGAADASVLGTNYGGGDGIGGGIYAQGTILSVTASTISGNSAQGGAAEGQGDNPTGGGAGLGGGVYASSGTFTSTTVSGNTATGGAGDAAYSVGGGTARGGGISVANGLVITGCVISDNRATAVPGPAYAPDASGGGVYGSGNVQLTQSTVSGNTAVAANADTGYGGNAAGGGVCAGMALAVFDSTIASNSVVGGSGADATAGPRYPSGPGGDALGGGVFCSAIGTATVTDSTIAANTATGGRGGNASLLDPGSNGGTATGGIDSDSTLKLLNTTVSGNKGTGGAGGAKDVLPTNVNEPGGAAGAAAGGLGIAAGTALVDNSIVAGNNAGGAPDISGRLLPSGAYNLIGTGGGLTNGKNGNQVGVTNPRLGPVANNGGPTQTMALLPGSPAINAGSNALAAAAGLYADQRGLPRVSGGKVDIGAYELQAAGGASISGTFYNDLNHDGKHESNEPGLAGWQVYIDANNTGVYVPGDITTWTSSTGAYKFTGLAPGTYRIREVRMTGWTRTEPAGVWPLGDYLVTVMANQSVLGKDFGDYLP